MHQEITSDSIPLGWKNDAHERMLLLIRDGRVIHSEVKADRQLAQGRTVIEHDIIDWAIKKINDEKYCGHYVWRQREEVTNA